MKKLSMYLVFGLALVVLAGYAGAAEQVGAPPPREAPPSQAPPPREAPPSQAPPREAPPSQAPQAQSFEGALVKVDTEARMLTAKATDNKEWQFRFTEQTEVVGPEKSIQGLAGKTGANLKITYRAAGGTNTATRIEVMPEKK